MNFKISSGVSLILAGGGYFLSSCTLAPSAGERLAGDEVTRIGSQLQSSGSRAALQTLTPQSPLSEYVRFGALNHPEVRASYLDWRATVSAVAPNRALPDPQLTFQADIASTVMSLMPGLMFDIMTSGKRATMATEALFTANVSYRAYVGSVLKVASEVRKGAIELAYVDEALRLRDESITALDQAAKLADAAYSTGQGMATLETQVRLANEIAKIRSDVVALGDRQRAARAKFKSALGLRPADPDPAWPKMRLAATPMPSADELWTRACAGNADLGRMRAMVEMALAQIAVARKAGTPDFSVGAMADLKADPLMIRPTATLTLPIWREKIRANIAAAESRRDAAAARVSAEDINLAAEVAQMLYMIRESDLMIEYIDTTALPNYDRVIASVEASYQAGMGSPAMIPETRVMQVGMRLERIAALRDRENTVTDLMLMTADVGSPVGSLFSASGSSSH